MWPRNTQGITNPDATTLTITDDDRPALSIGDAAAAEGDSGGAALEFRVTLDRAALEQVRVDWATADGTAQAGADYRAASGSLTFGVEEISKTVSVTASGDNVDEPNETYTVRLSNASGAILGKAVGTGTITDDDDAPTATLDLSPASISENGGESAVTARLSHPSSADTTVGGVGFGRLQAGRQRGADDSAGATRSAAPVTLTALDNRTDAPEKLVTVSAAATNAQGVEGPQAVTLTITDDDERADGDAAPFPGVHFGERRGERGDGEPVPSVGCGHDGDGVGVGRLQSGRERGADDSGGRDGERGPR